MRQRIVFEVHCPGCGRRIRAPSIEERSRRVLVHVRNCSALGFGRNPAIGVPELPGAEG